jgi:hypothetical protein
MSPPLAILANAYPSPYCIRLSRDLMTADVACQYSVALATPLPRRMGTPASTMAISAPTSADASMSSFMLPRWPMRKTCAQRQGTRSQAWRFGPLCTARDGQAVHGCGTCCAVALPPLTFPLICARPMPSDRSYLAYADLTTRLLSTPAGTSTTVSESERHLQTCEGPSARELSKAWPGDSQPQRMLRGYAR